MSPEHYFEHWSAAVIHVAQDAVVDTDFMRPAAQPLRDRPSSYSRTVQAAAGDMVRAAIAHGPDTPDAAAAVRHLVARLGEQHGPQFVQDVSNMLVVELAEATAAMTAEDEHEGLHRPDPTP